MFDHVVDYLGRQREYFIDDSPILICVSSIFEGVVIDIVLDESNAERAEVLEYGRRKPIYLLVLSLTLCGGVTNPDRT